MPATGRMIGPEFWTLQTTGKEPDVERVIGDLTFVLCLALLATAAVRLGRRHAAAVTPLPVPPASTRSGRHGQRDDRLLERPRDTRGDP